MNYAGAADENVPVLIDKTGRLGRIHLNRPKALNALTLDMVRLIMSALDDFEGDAQIAAVLVTAEGERAFCVGGDIRALYDSGNAGTDLCQTFWREEYGLNARVKYFSKPYIAVMDGITMGGGVGISAHGSHRIVTERTRLAMPETGIGFFPDVGGTWLLSRGPGEIGTYLGLTGETIAASDAIFVGLADLCVSVSRLAPLILALEKLAVEADAKAVQDVLRPFACDLERAPIRESASAINPVFETGSVEAIFDRLSELNTEFARRTMTVLRGKSPTSLKLTLRLLRLGRQSQCLEECLEREFAAGQQVVRGHDFYEGVRAAVIDKDRHPRWSPAELDDVTDKDVDAYLTAAPEPLFRKRP
jgi:enoyl-CoA hydratase